MNKRNVTKKIINNVCDTKNIDYTKAIKDYVEVNDEDYTHITFLDALQTCIDKIAVFEWLGDTCPPVFTLSLLYSKDKDGNSKQNIVMTINHGYRVSCLLYPQDNSVYGYEPLVDEMRSLYAQTM